MFNRFWSWLAYINFTISGVARGSKRIDDLRQEIKRTTSLLVHGLLPGQVRARFEIYENGAHVVYLNVHGLAWLLVPGKFDVSMQCTLNGKIIFTTDGKEEIPMESVVAAHRSLNKAMKLMLRQFGGLAVKLERVIEASKYGG